MPVSIRHRLLTLVMSWVVPVVAGALVMIYVTAQAEREAHERTLEDSARALSLVVDRELARRGTIATVMAGARSLDRLPELSAEDADVFLTQARQALAGIDGWIELSVAGRLLIDTRHGVLPREAQASYRAPLALAERTIVQPLSRHADTPLHAAIVAPVQRGGRTIANVSVTILPAEMQRIVDEQKLPADWYGTVIDGGRLIVARHPDGAKSAGRGASSDVRARLDRALEGPFTSVSLEGVPVTGFYRTGPQGWTFLTAMPEAPSGGFLQKAVLQVGLGAALMLGLGFAGALWVSRGIAAPVISLKRAAARLQAGQPVELASTGISECDEVVVALAEASETVRHARDDLEQRVADAVERTRDAEQRLSHSQRVEALGRLTGGVAHDFNNLLGVISNSARLVQRHAADRPALQMPVAAILRAVEVSSRLTQQLLRFAGRRKVHPQSIDLTLWLPELAELLASVVGERIRVQVSPEPGTRPVTADTAELELAIINIALNARDAMPTGGRLRVASRNALPGEVDELPAGDYVAITVSDDGEGVVPELSTRVFEPFFTTKAVGRGTGLGLAQVHGFCVQAGGTARLASVAGQGTTVTLLLPASTRLPGEAAPTAHALQPDALHGIAVLLVEDNEDLGDATEALLAAYGCTVERAADPEQALRIADTQGPFDAVLSDVMMPGALDGLDLARLLRERHPKLPVVLISGYSSTLTRHQEFTVLRKPCSDEELVAALLAAVGGPVIAD